MLALPAMYHDRSGLRNALLLEFDLFQEVQHTTGVTRHAVIRPGTKMVLPHGALVVRLERESTTILVTRAP